ncbi:MAG: hypothetical protein ACRDQ7_13065 [Haloechinothrix sp.]
MADTNLTLELGEGFSDDEVAVLIDGHEVWHRTGVTTNYSVGLADVIRLPAPSSPHATVEVRVRNLVGSQQVDSSATAGELRLRTNIDPAGALNVGAAPEGPVF